MAAVKTLRLNDGECVKDSCIVNFLADCCCTADPQEQCGSQNQCCRRCSDGVPPNVSIVDYICKCGKRFIAVEVTERTDAWKHKEKFVDKLEETRARFRDLQPILVIVSRELKLDRETKKYFNRRRMDVRVVRPSGSICS
ncbi:hypothetical protein PYWP30_00562 [Pyrobaculum sp. WP30]|nr:hypothetical protein PYWP30_00562 [Pyrobaculum sp. WP30]